MTASMFGDELYSALTAAVRRDPQAPKKLHYGTAGFRDRFDLPLHSVFVRMGIFAVLRSVSCGGRCIGAVITASHNPECDNGLKLVDADGGMFDTAWEPYAEKLANCPVDDFVHELEMVVEKQSIDITAITAAAIAATTTATTTAEEAVAVVVIGRDTRPHSRELMECVKFGVQTMGGIVLDLGEVTTPVLHFVVRDMNRCGLTSITTTTNAATAAAALNNFSAEYWLHRYYKTMSDGYTALVGTCPSTAVNKYIPTNTIVVDASFGVGSVVLAQFQTVHTAAINNTLDAAKVAAAVSTTSDSAATAEASSDPAATIDSVTTAAATTTAAARAALHIDIRNAAGAGSVNADCGAEHAQKQQLPPCGVHRSSDALLPLCSFDGDGDRIVFHMFTSSNDNTITTATTTAAATVTAATTASTDVDTTTAATVAVAATKDWVLYDGDKIAALFALLLQQELAAADLLNSFAFGSVQTAYANGASTAFLKQRNVAVAVAKTGVKHLHHTAAAAFDAGVYFEANGHGTALFSDRLVDAVMAYEVGAHGNVPSSASCSDGSSSSSGDRKDLAYRRLKACIQLINPAVGDALSDMLFCLAALQVLGLSFADWANLYEDLPSKQMKVSVPDKRAVRCSEDETRVLQPAALQSALDAAAAAVGTATAAGGEVEGDIGGAAATTVATTDTATAAAVVSCGRCFVRPSGTEDVVRIYAEAATQQQTQQLAQLVLDAIKLHLG